MRAVLCVVAVLATSGCASNPLISESERAQLGTVALAFAGDTPQPDFAGTRGRGTGAAQGAVGGAAVGFVRGLPFSLLPPIGVIFATVGATAGAVGGAVEGTPIDKVRTVEFAIDAGGTSELPQRLAASVLSTARDGGRELLMLKVPAGTTAARNPDYRALHDRQIDSVLEIGALHLVVRPLKKGPSDPDFALELSARTRVIRVADGRVVHDAWVFARSEARKASQWAAADGRWLAGEFDRMVGLLAADVVGSVFVVYREG